MLHEAEHGPVEKKLLLQYIKQARRSRKTPLPKSLEPGPGIGPGLAIFYTAFWDLISERVAPEAPIPWSKIRLWADVHDLDKEATEALEYFIRQMDLAFLKWKADNSKRKEGRKPKGSGNDGDARSVRGQHAPVRPEH